MMQPYHLHVGNSALAARASAHTVSFYEHDEELVAVLARFVSDGLSLGERVIVVATPAHREALDAALRIHGTDPNLQRATDRLMTLDARSTLDSILLDGVPTRPVHADRGGDDP